MLDENEVLMGIEEWVGTLQNLILGSSRTATDNPLIAVGVEATCGTLLYTLQQSREAGQMPWEFLRSPH